MVSQVEKLYGRDARQDGGSNLALRTLSVLKVELFPRNLAHRCIKKKMPRRILQNCIRCNIKLTPASGLTTEQQAKAVTWSTRSSFTPGVQSVADHRTSNELFICSTCGAKMGKNAVTFKDTLQQHFLRRYFQKNLSELLNPFSFVACSDCSHCFAFGSPWLCR